MSKVDVSQVKIAGFRKTSLIDYPDHISTVIFTQGCNCQCPYCHNPGLVSAQPDDKEYMDLEYFWSFLQERKHLLDGVVITGGEPTLQEGLVEFIKNIKNMNLKVKLDTNGSHFEVIRELIIDNNIDYLALDLKASLDNYQKISGSNITEEVRQTVDLIFNTDSEFKSEFRTTVVPDLHKKKDIEKIAKLIKNADKYTIQNFRPKITLDSKLQEQRRFSETELKEFKQIAEDFVEEVEIKN